MYKFVLRLCKIYTMSKKYNNSNDTEPTIAAESVAFALESPYAILKVASIRPENHLSAFEKMKAAKDGISKKDLESLKSKTGMDYTSLANALSVTRATLINKKKNEKFGLSLSEKILDIADLYAFGFEVFEDESAFREWMNSPIRALNYQRPLDLIDNQFGREEIRNIIGRISYGVYS